MVFLVYVAYKRIDFVIVFEAALRGVSNTGRLSNLEFHRCDIDSIESRAGTWRVLTLGYLNLLGPFRLRSMGNAGQAREGN